MLSVVLLVVGFALGIAGVALLSIPAALIVGGIALTTAALLIDFDNLTTKGGGRG